MNEIYETLTVHLYNETVIKDHEVLKVQDLCDCHKL